MSGHGSTSPTSRTAEGVTIEDARWCGASVWEVGGGAVGPHAGDGDLRGRDGGVFCARKLQRARSVQAVNTQAKNSKLNAEEAPVIIGLLDRMVWCE
jgi:hypothetical protein